MRDKEIEENLKLVTFTLKKYFNKYDEDLFQIGCIGLIKAVDTYEESRIIAKSTYYVHCILTELLNDYRTKHRSKRNNGKTDYSLNNICVENIDFIDIIPSSVNIEEDFIKNEQIDRLYQCYDKLEDREKIVIMYYFGLFDCDKKKQKEIGEMLDISQNTVSTIIKNAIKKLRRLMEDD